MRRVRRLRPAYVAAVAAVRAAVRAASRAAAVVVAACAAAAAAAAGCGLPEECGSSSRGSDGAPSGPAAPAHAGALPRGYFEPACGRLLRAAGLRGLGRPEKRGQAAGAYVAPGSGSGSGEGEGKGEGCLLYTSPSPRDRG